MQVVKHIWNFASQTAVFVSLTDCDQQIGSSLINIHSVGSSSSLASPLTTKSYLWQAQVNF